MNAEQGTFPHVLSSNTSTYKGIKMRDYIAIKAMQGIAANPAYAEASYEQAATMAYGYADALIERSEVKDEQKSS